MKKTWTEGCFRLCAMLLDRGYSVEQSGRIASALLDTWQKDRVCDLLGSQTPVLRRGSQQVHSYRSRVVACGRCEAVQAHRTATHTHSTHSTSHLMRLYIFHSEHSARKVCITVYVSYSNRWCAAFAFFGLLFCLRLNSVTGTIVAIYEYSSTVIQSPLVCGEG